MTTAITMAKVQWNVAIDCVKGSLVKAKKSGHGSYLIGKHYRATGKDGVYVHPGRYERSTQPSTKELKARERFAGVAAMVTARRADLTKIVADQQAFLAQKDTAGGAKTMRSYLWLICGQEYDQQHGS